MKEDIIKATNIKNKGGNMSFENIKIFILGFVLGLFVVIFLIWFVKSSIFKTKFKDSSFLGATSFSEIIEAKKDLKLYQDGKEIGILFHGTRLEKTLHVDKIDHYSLNIIFEPFYYENINEILNNTNIKDFSVTDLIYMDNEIEASADNDNTKVN